MRFLLLLPLFACAEMALPPTFPREAAGRPVVAEQALLGLSSAGDAAVAQLFDAEGEAPELTLAVFDRAGAPTRVVSVAKAEVAAAVARRVRDAGHTRAPVLAAALAAEWPQATARAVELGFLPRAPAQPEEGKRRWVVRGAAAAGSLPLALQLADAKDPRALLLLLTGQPEAGAGGDGVELTRMPLIGEAVAPELWIEDGVAWLLSGSFLPSGPLHRTVGLRRGSLARGEAELHNARGLARSRAGDTEGARGEFGRATAADPGFADGLYNAASALAEARRPDEAVALLRRAAAIDPGRVQVLGRNDGKLKDLRDLPEVRALLGLRRMPPENVPQPP